jgi:hypothetical protein
MSPSLYEIGINPYIGAFEAFKAIFQKAKDHAGIEADSYLTARLYEDMYPLSYQVQVVTYMAIDSIEKLVPHLDVPKLEDNETTMQDLIARAEKGLDMIRKIDPKDLEGVEDKVVQFSPRAPMDVVVTDGKGYALGFTTPNLYFHLTTAYAILRMKGVPLGKMDYWLPCLETHVHSRHKYIK